MHINPSAVYQQTRVVNDTPEKSLKISQAAKTDEFRQSQVEQTGITKPSGSVDYAKISTDAMQKLNEERQLNDKAETDVQFEINDKGLSIVTFTEKDSGEVIKQFPTKEAIKNIERIDDFLSRVGKDIKGTSEAGPNLNIETDGLLTDAELSSIVKSFQQEDLAQAGR